MKKLFILVFTLLFIIADILAQDFECVSCYHNNVDFSKYASAVGSANSATGSYSFVGGFRSQATGSYSYAFGNSNFATGESATALGIGSRATGKGSFVVGWQSESLTNYSTVIGSFSKANGFHSIVIGYNSESSGAPGYIFGSNCKIGNSSGFLFGNRLRTMNKHTFIIGDGGIDTTLTNNVEYSLVVGFDSNLPTLFVGPSNGAGTTGRIGIGNVTAPEAKLHIRADATEHARIKLEYTGSDKEAAILFGDGSQSITTSHEMPFTFKSAQNDYYFENGNVGIGKNMPDAKLHLFSNANNSRLRLEIFDNETSNKSWDFNNANGTLKLQYGSSTTGKPTMEDKMVITGIGNVGIGTDTPSEKLQIADGDIFIQDIDHGIIMRSPDGNCWRGTVNNNGMLEFAQINCETLETGINSPEPSNSAQIKIYPNPAGNQVFITCEESITGLQLEINDINGQLISSHKLNNSENIINLNSFQPGTYLFRLTDKNGEQIAVEKVIKE